MIDPKNKLALALDVSDLSSAKRLITQTRDSIGTFKVGLELFTAVGPVAVSLVHEAGARCFLDLKLHDIPATMARAVKQISKLGVNYLTVHAAAGTEALQASQKAAGSSVQLLAVTLLTSLNERKLQELEFVGTPAEITKHLAQVAWNVGVRGFVASPNECKELKEHLGSKAFVATPGIRPSGSDPTDQKRIATPSTAIANGSDLLVVGRPIRDADNPAHAAEKIASEVRSTLGL